MSKLFKGGKYQLVSKNILNFISYFIISEHLKITSNPQPHFMHLCLLHTFGRESLAFQIAPREYETEIAAYRLLKSRFQVELNSTGSGQVVLALATSGDLVASLSNGYV